MEKLTKEEIAAQSLNRAINGNSTRNYMLIIEGFIEKGIPAEEIIPRENVLTFNAWKALDRIVKKGEKGIKIVSMYEQEKEIENGEKVKSKRFTSPTVFHISQTKSLKEI